MMANAVVVSDDRWLRLALVFALGDIASSFGTMMIFVALPTIIKTFGDPIGAGWAVSSYLLVAAASAAICGRLGDLFGRKTLLLIMLVLASVGFLVSIVSTSLIGMIVGRALQGALGAVVPLCMGLCRAHLPASRLNQGVGMLSSAGSIGSGAALLIGGLLIDLAGWRYLFGFNLLLTLLTIPLVVWIVPTFRNDGAVSPRLDIVGGLLFLGAILSFLLGLSLGQSRGWHEPLPWILMAANVVLGIVWFVYERRHSDPLIDTRLLVQPEIAVPIGCAFLMGLGAMQCNPLLLLLLQQPTWTVVGIGLSATMAGLIKIPSNLVGILLGPLAGYLTDRSSPRLVTVIGFALNVAGWITLLLVHDQLWVICCVLVVFLIAGQTIMNVGLFSALVQAAPQARSSEVTGMMIVIRSSGQAIGAQLLILLLATSTIAEPGKPDVKFPTENAYLIAMTAILATCVLATLVATRTRPRPATAPADRPSLGSL